MVQNQSFFSYLFDSLLKPDSIVRIFLIPKNIVFLASLLFHAITISINSGSKLVNCSGDIYLTRAQGEPDDLTSPSAAIATGQLFRGGTNYFDLRQQIMF